MPPEEFRKRDLAGARFEDVRLREAVFENVNLSHARFENVDLSHVVFHNINFSHLRIVGAWMHDVEIEAGIEDTLIVNGVDVMPYVEAELNARHPDRATVMAVRDGDADAFRAAWAVDLAAWERTVERARKLPEEKLHERVDGEWSFIETLRHLVFATDSWIRRALLGDPSPYDPLGLPFSEMGHIPGVPNDPDARPSLDEVLALRADRVRGVTEVIEGLTDEQLAGMTEAVGPVGYPESTSFPVRRCLSAIVIEEWAHNQFANRDLAVLEAT